jgi:cysteinyl-tRNA synthetase
MTKNIKRKKAKPKKRTPVKKKTRKTEKKPAQIRLYNTASRKKEAFKPIRKTTAYIYACGPTVYDYAHIGHFFAYVFVDTLRRVLRFNGIRMKTVMNITDVGHLTSDADTGEDKIEKAAREKKMDVWKIAAYYTKDFFDAMRKLNIEKADIISKATNHVKEMIELVQKMEKRGFTYKTSDGIYYDTSKFKGYADFARLNLQKLKEGTRIEKNPEKKNPSDFALWKFSPPDVKRQMEWDSPWGRGFPGWHIECTAMSMKYLGDKYDIHTGGIDHIPVHHTNEIAQAYGATGDAGFVNYWLHNNHLMVDGAKMSKSKQNFYNMADIEAKGFEPLALRYLFLTAHYRTRLNFTWESLEAAEKALDTLRSHMVEWKNSKDKTKSGKRKLASYESDFLKGVNDDLNTPAALSIMWKLIRDKDVNEKDKRKMILEFDEVLGLKLNQVKPVKKKLSTEIKELIKKRERFRKAGKYQESDEIRKRLDKEFGVLIEDTTEGTEWKFKKK